jgi:hypothetical protein
MGWRSLWYFLEEFFYYVVLAPFFNRRIDRLLKEAGFKTLSWPESTPSHVEEPDLWHNASHPGPDLTFKLLKGWLNKIKGSKKNKFTVLVVGDSTIAYNTECWRDNAGNWHLSIVQPAKWSKKLNRYTNRKCWFQAVCGSGFVRLNDKISFIEQLDLSIDAGFRYNAVLLVGGWNQVYDPWSFFKLPKLIREFSQRARKALKKRSA